MSAVRSSTVSTVQSLVLTRSFDTIRFDTIRFDALRLVLLGGRDTVQADERGEHDDCALGARGGVHPLAGLGFPGVPVQRLRPRADDRPRNERLDQSADSGDQQ